MSSWTMPADTVEEQWTPTTIKATFSAKPPSLDLRSPPSGISVELPLLNLGWTFALSFIPEPLEAGPNKIKKKGGKSSTKTYKWKPVTLAFHQHGDAIHWANASMRAELFIANTPVGFGAPSLALLGTMEVALAHTSSLEISLSSSALSLSSPTKLSLTVAISECPFSNGFFHVRSSCANGVRGQAWLAGQSGDHLLSQSLTTGKIYDVKFLTRSTCGHTEEYHETYASLPILEQHVNLTTAKLSEGWTSALAALDHSDADEKNARRILPPSTYEYEPDSDYDEEASPPPTGQQSDSENGGPSCSFSSSELDGASDLGSVESFPKVTVKSHKGLTRLASKPSVEGAPAISVDFAAHRTWHAFLWYCYTGHLKFNKLKSQVEDGVQHSCPVGDGPPSCSPKSMYRLADLVGDEDLKTRALEAIRNRMTETNVLDEAFSIFTSKYPGVREVQLDVLMEHCESREVKKAFLRTMLKFGSMPHAQPVLEAFYDRLAA